jgi:hypothetical protein
MQLAEKSFKGQLKGEEVVCWFRRHWLMVFPRALLFISLIGLSMTLIGLFFVSPERFQSTQFSITFVIAMLVVHYLIHRTFFSICQFYFKRVFISNYRVVMIDRSLFFTNEQISIDLDKIQDIHVIQNGILQSFLNFGELVIVLSAANEEIHISRVPRPHHQFKMLHHVKKSFWQFYHRGGAHNLEHKNGGMDGTRTRDLLRDRQAL